MKAHKGTRQKRGYMLKRLRAKYHSVTRSKYKFYSKSKTPSSEYGYSYEHPMIGNGTCMIKRGLE